MYPVSMLAAMVDWTFNVKVYRCTHSVSMLAAMEDGAGDGGGKLWVSHMGASGCGGLKKGQR